MIITHHTGECIKIVSGGTTLVFNPISKKSKLTPVRFSADIAFVSLNHPDFNGVAEVATRGAETFAITGPGEYEVQNVFVKGVPSESAYAPEATINTIYSVRIEDINVLFLGALSDKKGIASVVEDMESVDVLFVPIGGDGVLAPDAAHELAVSLEAKIIIPIHYDALGEKGALTTFLKEAGAEGLKPVDKLTVKRKDVEAASSNVVLIAS